MDYKMEPFRMRINITIMLLLWLVLTSQQTLACNFIPLDNRKWTYNPVVLLDAEFKNPEYKAVAEKAINQLNEVLEEIQLEVEQSDENFVRLSTWLQNGGSVQGYATYWTNLINNNMGKILVIIDEGNNGFGGSYSDNIGILNIKPSAFDNLKLGTENVHWQEAGDDYVQENVLTHELAHTLNIRHLPPALDFRDNIGFPNFTSLRTRPVMNKYVLRSNYGLTEADKHAIRRTYGFPCGEKNHLQIHMENSEALNVALIPTRPKIKRFLNRRMNNHWNQRYIKRVNENAVTASFLSGTADLFANSGRYIIAVRSLSLTGQSWDYEADFGEPQFEGIRYLRYRPRFRDYILVSNPRRATGIRVREDMEIEL
jgi:hypothetical protein